MMVKPLLAMLLSVFLVTGPVFARTLSPEGAQVYFISPKDGDAVRSPVTVVFGLKGMGVAPAGADKSGTGHHHLLIDGTATYLRPAWPSRGISNSNRPALTVKDVVAHRDSNRRFIGSLLNSRTPWKHCMPRSRAAPISRVKSILPRPMF